MKTRCFIFVSTLFLALGIWAAPALASTGFVTSPLWLNPEMPKDGDQVTLSVLFHNAETETISGTVVFYDGEVLLSKKPMTILSNEVGTASTSFSINAGDHQFSATMSTMSKLLSSGKLEIVTLPVATVELPKQFIPKVVPITAQAGGDTITASETPILNQINSAEQKVLSTIPDPTKNAIGTVAQTIDSWRSDRADDFSSGVDAAKATIAAQSKTTTQLETSVLGTKTITKKIAPSNPIDGPFAYVKLFFYTILSFLFATPIIFYLFGILLIFLFLRFIFRRVRNGISSHRGTARNSSASQK